MIEIAFLALLHRLMNWGLVPLVVTRTVAADAPALHRLLSDPTTQLHLAGRPPNIGMRVKPTKSGRVITVELLRGTRTLLWATWILTPGRGTTEVDLALQFERRGLATRLALMLGGRRWLARRAEGALAQLAQTCARAAEDVLPAPTPAPAPVECTDRARMTRSPRHTHRIHARHR